MPSVVLLQRDPEASPRLRALIEASDTFSVSSVVHTVHDARGVLQQGTPDILVTDMRAQDGSVHPLLAELSTASSRPHVLATLLAHDDALLLDALHAGADGYWVHSCEPGALAAALEQLWRGESPITPTIARHVLSHFHLPQRPLADIDANASGDSVLTGAEQELLHWAAQGYLIDEIAQQWHESVHHVACGIRRVYQKLQVDRREPALSLRAA